MAYRLPGRSLAPGPSPPGITSVGPPVTAAL